MAVLREPPESKFVYVVVTARRARQLQSGAAPMLAAPKSHKPTRIAQEELEKGLLEYEMAGQAGDTDETEGKRRKE